MGMVVCLRGASAEDLAVLRSDPDAADGYLFSQDAYEAGDVIDFDKAWHALHFMLTGQVEETDHPLSFLLKDPERLGTDNGYGGPWILSPERTAKFHAELEKLSDEQIIERYDPAAMVAADVYLADTFADEGEEAIEYIMQGVPALRALLNRCANSGSCIIGIIT